MSSYDNDGGDTRSKRLIQDRQERLEHVLDIFVGQAADVDLSPHTKRKIAVHIVNFHRVLSKFEGEAVLSEGDIPDISPIRQRLGRTVKIPSSSKGRCSTPTYEDVPAVDELDVWYLEEVANQLEAAAKKLGYWGTAKSGKGELYSIKLNPEDYDDPVSDDVKKPQ